MPKSFGANMTDLRAPFPYFGGKRRWASTVWDRLGQVDCYVEPFAGSMATLLSRPGGAHGREVVADTSGLICNFWRAIAADSDAVKPFADWPVIHQDMIARHEWLVKWQNDNGAKLCEDPEYYDAQAAGYWAWGQSSSCFLTFGLKEDSSVRGIPHQDGRGVARTRKEIPYAVDGDRLGPWFRLLAERLSNVIIVNRDWSTVVKPSFLTFDGAKTHGIFLDPPYVTKGRRDSKLYKSDFDGESDDVAAAAWQWALEHGDQYRIAYACHEGDFDLPLGWDAVLGEKFKMRSKQAARDMVIFSPACARPRVRDLFALG